MEGVGGLNATYDVTVVGGGIVGLATALALTESDPRRSVLVLEKEAGIARHQSGHNSGVIHSGLYYRPGSLKARFARAGARSMVDFCAEHGIDHHISGKVVVAVEPDEVPRLDALYQRGLDNGLQVERIGPAGVRDHEPHCESLGGIWVPTTGVVDYAKVAETYARLLADLGCEIRCGVEVRHVDRTGDEIHLSTNVGTFRTASAVNCAGLHSDRVAVLDGASPGAKIVPFRGEYYELVPDRRELVRGLIYPVPDPDFPFLGVHLTRGVDGSVHAGPNAVPALAREGYRKRDIDVRDVWETVRYPGFRRLVRRHWRMGIDEVLRSVSRARFLHSLQRLVPAIQADDIRPTPAGVRAQALTESGHLVDDFLVIEQARMLHVCNAPSPAATASLEIGRYVAERVLGDGMTTQRPQESSP